MATRTELHDPETIAVQDRHGEQASKGVAGKLRRYLAEPAFIAGCGMAGALFEVQHGGLHGDTPVIGMAAAAAGIATGVGGMAAAAAGIATGVGITRFLVRESYRRGWRMVGGLAVRFAFILLCLCFELYGFSCWCDANTADLPQMIP